MKYNPTPQLISWMEISEKQMTELFTQQSLLIFSIVAQTFQMSEDEPNPYLRPSRTSLTELFCKNSEQVTALNNFSEKAPS